MSKCVVIASRDDVAIATMSLAARIRHDERLCPVPRLVLFQQEEEGQ